MRGIFSLLSLLIIGLVAAFYMTSAQPEFKQAGQYQGLESKVAATTKLMQHDPQADVDAATARALDSSAVTNTPPTNN